MKLKSHMDRRISRRKDLEHAESFLPLPDVLGTANNALINAIRAGEELLEENEALKQQLLDIEQLAPIQWETILAEKLNRAIRENNKKDYLEITNSINNDIFVITIQRKFGQTPEQLQKQSDIRRFKAANKIVNLSKSNREMAGKLAKQTQQILTLTALRMPDLETQLKTRDDIQRAIDQVNVLIKNYNKQVFARQMGKLTGSMQASYRESWSRAAQSAAEVLKLKKEILVLKSELNRKRVEKSKFAKYRQSKKLPGR